ncbi:MAG TPA: hypothetical protein VNP03_19035, partial [Pseudonocardia sp.]|nr:hypothetical protein [Pseudonocardia sp.]
MSPSHGRDDGGAPPGRLRTVSLRRRVVLYSLAVLGVVLVLVSGLVLLVSGVQARADLTVQLSTRAALAERLAAQGVPPATIVERVRAPAVRVRLVDRDGTSYDSAGARANSPTPVRVDPAPPDVPDPADKPGPPDSPGAPDMAGPPGASWRHGPTNGPVLRRALPNGAQLTLYGDSDLLTNIQRQMSRLLVLLGLGGLAVAGLALLATTRVALGPLDTMTALARSIAAGDRGRRLAPTRPDTELGRT